MSENINYYKYLKNIDSNIRKGQFKTAAQSLQSFVKSGSHLEFKPQQITLEGMDQLTYLAHLCRRADLPDLTVQLLSRRVRGEQERKEPASAKDQLEYAAALTHLGATFEAQKLLKEISPDEDPFCLLYLAFSQMGQWDYVSSENHLSAFLKRVENGAKPLDPYWIRVAKVNYAASLAQNQKVDLAFPLLDELLQETLVSQNLLLRANLLGIYAHLLLDQGDWVLAQKALDEAGLLLKKKTESYSLMIQKGKAVLELKRLQGSSKSVEQKCVEKIRAIKTKALQLSEFETARDCDFYLAKETKNSKLARHLFFGTSHSRYQDRVKKLDLFDLEENPVFYWNPPRVEMVDKMKGEDGSHRELIRSQIDILTSQVSSKSGEFQLSKPGHLIQRLLFSLSTDFYRPFRTAEIHEILFPDSFYNPLSSPVLVRQGILRLRKALKKCDVPLEVQYSPQGYRLKNGGGVSLKVQYEGFSWKKNSKEVDVKVLNRISTLKVEFKETPFTSRNAVSVLKESPRSVNRYLQEGARLAFLEKIGKGKSTCYQVRV